MIKPNYYIDNISFKEFFIERLKYWWYSLDAIFYISFEISAYEISFNIKILNIKLQFQCPFIYFPLTSNFIEFLRKIFDKNWSFNIFKIKSFEFQTWLRFPPIIGFTIGHTMHCNHAGFILNIQPIICEIYLKIYDCRRWDYDNNTWEKI